MEELSVAGIGLLVGAISSLLGLGGGVLIVPLLPMVVEMSQREVIATSLLTIWLVVSNNSRGFHKKGLVNWSVALLVGPASAVGAYAAGRATAYMSDSLLKFILAGVLCVFALRVFFVSSPEIEDGDEVKTLKQSFKEKKAGFSFLLGGAAGMVSGLSGVGSGVILGPSLIHFRLVPNSKVSPTSNGIMIFTTLLGFIAYTENQLPSLDSMRWGLIHLEKVFILFVGAFVTSWIFRRYQHLIPGGVRKKILGIMLLALGARVLVQALG